MTVAGRFRNTAKCFSFTEGAVDRTNIDEIAKAIASLNVWKKASKPLKNKPLRSMKKENKLDLLLLNKKNKLSNKKKMKLLLKPEKNSLLLL